MGTFPLLFLKKKCLDFGKKYPGCVHTWVQFLISNAALRVSRRKKNSKHLPCGAFLCCRCCRCIQVPFFSRNLPYPFVLPRCFPECARDMCQDLRCFNIVNPTLKMKQNPASDFESCVALRYEVGA